MKIAEILNEGGNMFPDVGVITKPEALATIQKLSKLVGIDLMQRTLGSTGKAKVSGDLDFSVTPDELKEVTKKLESKFDNVRKVGVTTSIPFPIVKFDKNFQTDKPRTGKVQVDFIPNEDIEWSRNYYHSPGEDSKAKGAHRNAAIAFLASINDKHKKITPEKDDFGRPVVTQRLKYGQRGLELINRKSKRNVRTGKWNKTQVDEIIKGPERNMDVIAKTLFGKGASKKDLHSIETIVAAIKKYKNNPEEILKALSKDFKDSHNPNITNSKSWPSELK